VQLYQSMDDMWKQYAFMNEKGNLRQVLLDQGIEPDEVVRELSYLLTGLPVENN
jgi:hypothetical protein